MSNQNHLNFFSSDTIIVFSGGHMSSIWRNMNNPPKRRRYSSQEEPVLDQHRNKIRTFESFSQPKPTEMDHLRQKGYQIIGQIGRGGYGVVYKAKSLDEQGRICAIKVNYDVVARSTIYFQVAFFHLVRKKSNLPKMIDFFYVNDTPYIVLEFFEHQQFIEIFEKIKDLKEVKHYLLEILKGISSLKSIGVYHRDIKPMNFLYSFNDKKGILIDFGLAQIDKDYFNQVIKKRYEDLKAKVPEKQWKLNPQLLMRKEQMNIYDKLIKANEVLGYSKVGTQSYVPIETLFYANDQGHECQIWSVGIILLMFLTQKIHFFNEPKELMGTMYICIFVMEMAHLFGKQAIQQRLRRFCGSVSFPKNMPPKGDLKKMIALKSKDYYENQIAYDLLLKFLELDPEERITVEQAIWHPFFDEVRQEHFKSEGQRKWYKKQMQKKNSNQENQQMGEAPQQKSMSNMQAESSFSKSYRKVKAQSLSKQQQGSQQESVVKKSMEVGKKQKTQQKKSEESASESSQKQMPPHKKERQAKKRKDSISDKESSKSIKNNLQKNNDQKIKSELPERTEDIMTTIRKYIIEKQITINEAACTKKSDRIDIHFTAQRQKAKNPKVTRKTATVPEKEPKQKQPKKETKDKKKIKKQKQLEKQKQKQKKQQKQQKKLYPETEVNKQEEELFIVDEKIQQIFRKEQQRLKMQVIGKIETKKTETNQDQFEDYCDSDDT